MKNYIYSLFFCLVVLVSCNENDEIKPNERNFDLSAFDKVSVGTNIKLTSALDNDSEEANNSRRSNEGDLHKSYKISINGNPEVISGITVEVIDGVAYISSSQPVTLSDSVEVVLETFDLVEVRLEADQHAIFDWYMGDAKIQDLSVVTEANSLLAFYGLQANNIYVKQEAESNVILRNDWIIEEDSLALFNSGVEIIDDFTILVDGTYRYTASSVEIYVNPTDETEYVIIKGDTINATFISNYLEFKTEATTTMDAGRLTVLDADVRMEGESEAYVWALNSISGTGKGQSALYYTGSPTLDYFIEGSAQVIAAD